MLRMTHVCDLGDQWGYTHSLWGMVWKLTQICRRFPDHFWCLRQQPFVLVLIVESADEQSIEAHSCENWRLFTWVTERVDLPWHCRVCEMMMMMRCFMTANNIQIIGKRVSIINSSSHSYIASRSTTNFTSWSSALAERVVEKAQTPCGLINYALIMCRRFIVHAPRATDKLQSSLVHQHPHLIPQCVVLLTPPFRKECWLDIDKSLFWIAQ